MHLTEIKVLTEGKRGNLPYTVPEYRHFAPVSTKLYITYFLIFVLNKEEISWPEDNIHLWLELIIVIYTPPHKLLSWGIKPRAVQCILGGG